MYFFVLVFRLTVTLKCLLKSLTQWVVGCSFHFVFIKFSLAASDLLQAQSHRQDSTYHGFYYTHCKGWSGMRNSSMSPPTGINPSTH